MDRRDCPHGESASRCDDCARSHNARHAVNASWANTVDWSSRTAPARDARWQKYLDKVDPDGTLPPGVRAKRAEKAMQVEMTRMSKLGVAARKRKAAARKTKAP